MSDFWDGVDDKQNKQVNKNNNTKYVSEKVVNNQNLDEETYKDLFWQVFNANGEKEIDKIVKTNALFKNQDNWYPYGGKDKNDTSNHATFNNQQSDPIAAFVEKITNSIDSLLLKECKLQNIDPEDIEKAPSSMSSAVEKFFNVKNGDLNETNIGELAKNIQIIATGMNRTPDLTIYDNGEGQYPNKFKDTFVSLLKNNKTKIHFVQGKYNMGSTGALVFCGSDDETRYQLIASKRNSELSNKENSDSNLFGWTLVRAKPPQPNDRAVSYEYFAISGQIIPAFEINELDLGLHNSIKFTSGAIVKLYSYQMPRGCAGSMHADLYRELNLYLYKPALPLWIYEDRIMYKKLKKTSNFVKGNYLRHESNSQETDDKNRLEQSPIFINFQDDNIGNITIQAIVLKKGENDQQDGDRIRNFINQKHIIYTDNGQLQYFEGLSFITKNLGLNYIKKHLFIHIDCSKMNPKFRRGFFQGSRDRVNKIKLETLNEQIIKQLKNNNELKIINEQRKELALSGVDDKHEKEIIEKILSNTPMSQEMVNMLNKNGHLNLFKNRKNKGSKSAKNNNKVNKNFKKQRFPSIFKAKSKKTDNKGNAIFALPLGGSKKILFETNVEDGYLNRTQEQGKLKVEILDYKKGGISGDKHRTPNSIADIFDVNRTDSSNGIITLGLDTKNKQLNVGDQVKINTKLSTLDEKISNDYIEYVININIIDSNKNGKSKKEQENKPNMPSIIKIHKKNNLWQKDNGDKWSELGWDENSVIKIMPSGEGDNQFVDAIAINMSNNILKDYISKQKVNSGKKIDIVKDKYVSQIYLHGLFLYSIFEQINKKDDYKTIDSTDDMVATIFKEYGEVLLYLDTNRELFDVYDE